MTPQESALVEDLFDRLATLEAEPRDADAERLIANAGRRAPHALYALVQTVLVQDEALKRADARITELQALTEGVQPPEPEQRGFLDSMREAFGGNARQPAQQYGSVPGVRAAPQSPSQQQAQPPYAPQPGSPASPVGGGSSFLGTAASAAAGVIGGAMLADGIRSMFGHSSSAQARSPFGELPDRADSPWKADRSTSGSAADSDLARQAGIDHVDDAARRDADAGSGNPNDPDYDDADYDDSDGFDNDDDFVDVDAGADSDDSEDV